MFVQRLGLLSITSILLSLSGLILLPSLTKNLSVSEYGAWVQVMVAIGFICPLADMGLSLALMRHLSAEKDIAKWQEAIYSVAVFVFIMSLTMSALIYFASKTISDFFFGGWTGLVLLLLIVVPLVSMNTVWMTYFRARQQIKYLSILTVFQTYIGVLAVAYTATTSHSVVFAIWAYIAAQFFSFSISLFLVIKQIGFKKPDFSLLPGYLRFGMPLIITTVSTWIITISDRYFISYFLGITYVGYYAPGYGLGESIMLVMAPLGTLLPATLSQLYDENKKESVRKHILISILLFLLLAIPVAIVLSFFSKQILGLLTTAEIASSSYSVTPVIALGIMFYGVFGIVSNVLIIEKKTKMLAAIWIVSAAVNVIMNILLIPRIGIMGAAYATLVSYAVLFILAGLETGYFNFRFTFKKAGERGYYK